MGSCTESHIGYGFIIKKPQILALLRCLRKHDKEEIDSGNVLKESNLAKDVGPDDTGRVAHQDETNNASDTKMDEQEMNSFDFEGFIDERLMKVGLIDRVGVRFTPDDYPEDRPAQLIFYYMNEYSKGEDESTGHTLSFWGDTGNMDSNEWQEVVDLNPEGFAENTKETFKQLGEAFHFEEAGIKFRAGWIHTLRLS